MMFPMNRPMTPLSIDLYPYQQDAVDRLRSGSILVGGVGSGKSRTALAYYYKVECDGVISTEEPTQFLTMRSPKNLYIITTARKRDTLEWEKECVPFLLSTKEENAYDVKIIVDSWNNITKYSHIKQAFFIFDEQRLVGNGAWVKSFLKITKSNTWVLLSATPGDTWMDYVPVFLANGWYKNRTEFIRRHVVYSNFTKFPKIERYIETQRLVKLRDASIVQMHYSRKTSIHEQEVVVGFDQDLFNRAIRDRWHVFESRPIKDISELCYILRKIVNSDPKRLVAVKQLQQKRKKLIVFYNFNYELDLLLSLGKELGLPTAQWNGHKHEPLPTQEAWLYLVQYAAGAEGWNCIQTDAIVFFSQNYSYKATIQAAGRIDRLNTPYSDLYYYHIQSKSQIDLAIKKSLSGKKSFNEQTFAAKYYSQEKQLL